LARCKIGDTDRGIRANFDRQGRAIRAVVDPRVSFRSAFPKAFRPLSRPTGEPSRHGSDSPVSIDWRSSPARLITSSIAGRHEPAWGRSLAVACSRWQWRASVSSDRRAQQQRRGKWELIAKGSALTGSKRDEVCPLSNGTGHWRLPGGCGIVTGSRCVIHQLVRRDRRANPWSF
jgi:hypothetical protein